MNVSTFRSSFLRFPGTRLGRLMSCARVADMLQLCEEFVPGDPPEFFFDKNPENFGSVLEMYRSGKFHIPDGGRGEEGGHNVQMFSEAEVSWKRTNLHKVFTITEKAPTRAFSWLKASELSGPVHLHHRVEVLRILEIFVDLRFQL